MISNTPNRRYELDWLRVGAILIVFLYHSSRFFNLGDWHVKNPHTYLWIEMWNIFATRWMMPLFFVISGASLFYAIGKSGGFSRFYRDKFLRLMVPVLLAAVTHGALQIYLERLTHAQFSGSFFDFLPDYFRSINLGLRYPGNFAFHGMHLWYLLFLFLYSIIFYRLFLWLKKRPQDFTERITAIFTAPGLIYVSFSIPLIVIKIAIPRAVLSVGSGGWGFLYYIWFLIAGFIIVTDDRLPKLIERQRFASLLLGIVFTAIQLYLRFGTPEDAFLHIRDWLFALLSFLNAWTWTFTFWGFFQRHLAFDHPVVRFANEAVLPFYILHQTVLLILGYYIMAWSMHDLLKWGIVFNGSFITIMVLYLFLIQKFDILRFLFGMRTKSSHPFFTILRGKNALIIMHVLYIGLIVMVAAIQSTGANSNRSPMPLTYNKTQDIVLDVTSITKLSSTGVHVVNDEDASLGKAIEFTKGASPYARPQPEVHADMRFTAPEGHYIIWLRGKSDTDNDQTDSVWLQVDGQIGTNTQSYRLGNWLDIHPPGVYHWASDAGTPIAVMLTHSGEHTLRIQPRQTPHRIDQIWLSRSQPRIPDTNAPIK